MTAANPTDSAIPTMTASRIQYSEQNANTAKRLLRTNKNVGLNGNDSEEERQFDVKVLDEMLGNATYRGNKFFEWWFIGHSADYVESALGRDYKTLHRAYRKYVTPPKPTTS